MFLEVSLWKWFIYLIKHFTLVKLTPPMFRSSAPKFGPVWIMLRLCLFFHTVPEAKRIPFFQFAYVIYFIWLFQI